MVIKDLTSINLIIIKAQATKLEIYLIWDKKTIHKTYWIIKYFLIIILISFYLHTNFNDTIIRVLKVNEKLAFMET